jgi:hypothetical protein
LTEIPSSLFWWRLLQLVLAIPMLAILGQGLTWLLARGFGQLPEQNFFYRLLQVIASPAVKLSRLITPKVIADAHVPLVALSLLAVAYLWVMLEIGSACTRAGLTIARCLGGG